MDPFCTDGWVGGKIPFPPPQESDTIATACAIDPSAHLSLCYIPLLISSPCSLMHMEYVFVIKWKLNWVGGVKATAPLCLPVAIMDDSSRRID